MIASTGEDRPDPQALWNDARKGGMRGLYAMAEVARAWHRAGRPTGLTLGGLAELAGHVVLPVAEPEMLSRPGAMPDPYASPA